MTETEKIIEDFKYKYGSKIIKEKSIYDYPINNHRTFNWLLNECPFFIDEEIEQLRNYYAESTNESYYDYFTIENTNTIIDSMNLDRPHNKKSWNSRIMALQNKIKNSSDPEEIDKLKQNLVDLGWNPEIEYTTENQIKAKERYITLMNERVCQINIIDIHNYIESFSDNNCFTESGKDVLHSISVITVRTGEFFSGMITSITNSDFSHSALALDGNFTHLYSYNMKNNVNLLGGLSIESVKNWPKDAKIAIFTFFVNNKYYNKLKSTLEDMEKNIKNTYYSMFNILAFPFKNVSIERSDSMICSQFVDYCTKLVHMDITKTKSPKVSPGDLYRASIKNSKMYKTFDGYIKDLNLDKTKKALNRMCDSSRTIKAESAIGYNNINIEPLSEARKLPIEIKPNGDVLLTNPFPDFNEEYMASHKLLMQYNEAGNIEAMKYELARLYYMNYILEKKIYHNTILNNKEKNIKTRARILNDFNKYLKVVLKKNSNFNFSKYYEDTPFYPHTVEIKASTISNLKNVITSILV